MTGSGMPRPRIHPATSGATAMHAATQHGPLSSRAGHGESDPPIRARNASAMASTARSSAADAAAISGLGARKRRAARPVRAMRSGVMSTLVNKEWRLLRRDPLLLSQILMQLFYLIPLFLVFGTRLGEERAAGRHWREQGAREEGKERQAHRWKGRKRAGYIWSVQRRV